MNFRWKKIVCAVAVIAFAGVARLRPEQAHAKNLRDQGLQEPPPPLAMRQQLGQSFYLAVFGGFRSLVASLTEVEAVSAWQNYNYGKVDACYALACELQPRELHYWDFRYWMLAKNASHFFRYVDESRPGLSRAINQRYVDKGIKVLEDAIPWVGKDWHLWRTLGDAYGDIYYNNNVDWEKAAAAYEKGASLPKAKRFMWRMHVFALARVKGKELEAWDKLMALYDSPDEDDHVPTVLSLLSVLEEKVKALRPSARLPAALEQPAETVGIPGRSPRVADKLKEKWLKDQEKLKRLGPVQVDSPSLQQKAPGS